MTEQEGPKTGNDTDESAKEGAAAKPRPAAAPAPERPRRTREQRAFLINRYFPWLLNNLFAMAGFIIVSTSVIVFSFLFVVEALSAEPHEYFGVVFIFLPPVLAIGAMLIAFGWWLDRLGRARGTTMTALAAYFDLSRTRSQQQLLFLATAVATVMVFGMAIAGLQTYEYTESVEFCGETCHAVMKPEFVAYQASPHARVLCAECHIGSGARWHVRAKLSGMYQIYSYNADAYPRPLPTPLENLRPAQDTCEKCHWPAFFFGGREQQYRYYLSEGSEEPWEIDLLLKIGGVDQQNGAEGIHWHVDPDHRVEYMAADDKRQEIAWVRVTDSNGEQTVYTNLDAPPSDELLASGETRTMDCLDCHNRPAHRYGTPVELVNGAIDRRHIDPRMPEIKTQGLELLAASYETEDDALSAIEQQIRSFYEDEYPDYVAENPARVDDAVRVLGSLYQTNMFPEMKTRWDGFPDNSSHWVFPGCFRCHSGNMQSEGGETVSYACDTCHVIQAQGFRSTDWQTGAEGLPFVHPLDGEVIDEPTLCTDCHDGSLGY